MSRTCAFILPGLLAALLAAPGCARWQKAEASAHDKAVELEQQRVLGELQQQEKVLEQLLVELEAEQRTLADMQAREAAGDPVSEQERQDAHAELARLRKQLQDEKARHDELVREAQALGAL